MEKEIVCLVCIYLLSAWHNLENCAQVHQRLADELCSSSMSNALFTQSNEYRILLIMFSLLLMYLYYFLCTCVYLRTKSVNTASCHKLSNYQHAAMSTAQRALIKTTLVITEKVITYL